MPELNFVFKADKKKLIEQLNYYGIEELPYLLSMSGKEKIRGYSGNLTPDQIVKLNQAVGMELMGLYLFHLYPDNLRLSFDAIPALKDQITKNILEISEQQEIEFLKGRDIALTKEEQEKYKDETRGFKIIKCGNDLLGTAKLTSDRIVNYMPKERRLR